MFSPVRRHERFSVGLSVLCRTSERGLADQVVNLSAGGACVKTPTPLPAGSRHRFSFTVPDAKLRASIIDVDAVVAWSCADSMGLKFARYCGGIDDYLKRLERASNSL
ncbi:MAG: PilZ domain-containing protein [Archangiaceae bacterium]|nr:PilZ domain-containing protein [Archangiaceae bacterium]